MAGFKCDDFRKKLKILFENDDLGAEAPVEGGDSEAVYDDLKASAQKVSDVASEISTVEKLENDGTLSHEAHQDAEAKLSAELDAAIEDLVTNHDAFKSKEAEEGNPSMTDTPSTGDMSGEVEAGEEKDDEKEGEEDKEEEKK